MNILKEFDEALVREEMAAENTGRGYRIETSGKTYSAYMDCASWRAFKDAMLPEHRQQFETGNGKELEEKDGRPPKMASYASSSRMIYKLSKHKKDFVFEKKLSTTVGGMANLDGYLVEPQRYIFIESKCREPYGHKAEQVIKQNYRGIYEYLCRQMPDVFSCTMTDIPEAIGAKRPKNEMKVVFSCKGHTVAGFDIKQMICHLLAVATERLAHPDDKNVLFLYLLYDPAGLRLEGDVREEILTIHHDTCWAAQNYDFKTMFGHIVDYLTGIGKSVATEEEILHIKNFFDFVLCNQNDYHKCVAGQG